MIINKLYYYALLLTLLAAACTAESDIPLSTTPGQSGSITRFATYGHYMYVLNLNEVQTYDIAQPDLPVLVHELATDYGLETITIYDGTIYIGSTTALYILNLSNPAAPVIQAKVDEILGNSFTRCDPVVVKGNYAFSTIKIIANVCGQISSESALVVYDVTDKSNPVVLATYPMFTPNGLGYKDHYLFVCDEGSDQLQVFDISNPEAVLPTPYSISLTDPVDLIIAGQKMIVSTKTDFDIYDIGNIEQIQKIGRIAK
jgi:hypothetical protein